MKNRTRCTVWSRVVGYLRPVSSWNDGIAESFNDRVTFEEKRNI